MQNLFFFILLLQKLIRSSLKCKAVYCTSTRRFGRFFSRDITEQFIIHLPIFPSEAISGEFVPDPFHPPQLPLLSNYHVVLDTRCGEITAIHGTWRSGIQTSRTPGEHETPLRCLPDLTQVSGYPHPSMLCSPLGLLLHIPQLASSNMDMISNLTQKFTYYAAVTPFYVVFIIFKHYVLVNVSPRLYNDTFL